ncbi:Phage P2 GpE [Roseivivax halotolerans]|uniref:Phage P2 GpE n=1 Tax=Roseivivax halotolerans TaxID=93684 RepID=A0A1I5W4E2_9RHOB|nr:GpE family phage tail protein [Roseivivax halotolerans]SFQ14605.1 Phage P2 GpE [Roseivivax halotolerans]
MADLAVVFGWAPRDMDPMSLEELMRWHGHAGRRTPKQKKDT